MKHTLVVIGYMGQKRAYLDVSEEFARKMYERSEGAIDDYVEVKTIAFDDEFGAYDIWTTEGRD